MTIRLAWIFVALSLLTPTIPWAATNENSDTEEEMRSILEDSREDFQSIASFEKQFPVYPTDCNLSKKWNNYYQQKKNECQQEIVALEMLLKKAEKNFRACQEENKEACLFLGDRQPCHWNDVILKKERPKLIADQNKESDEFDRELAVTSDGDIDLKEHPECNERSFDRTFQFRKKIMAIQSKILTAKQGWAEANCIDWKDRNKGK